MSDDAAAMIKCIQLSTEPAALSHQDFVARWSRSLADAIAAAGSDAPLRAVACRVLHDVDGCTAPHDAIVLEWFRDMAALRRYEARVPVQPAADGVVIIAEEHVMRGSDWLERRWSATTLEPKYKHMALARRAAGLSAAQFSERWRNRPGRIGGTTTAPALEIPAAARGLAYVQNHAVQEGMYDAINEVYFDDLSTMRSRIAFFANHDVLKADAELVSAACFAIVEEYVIA